MKRILLNAIEKIRQVKALEIELRTKYATDYDVIIAAIKDDLIKREAINEILKLVPTCFKIGDKVFLLGDLGSEIDVSIHGVEFGGAYELFDMTTEMNTGHSYSFYTTSIEYFDFADVDETMKVKAFLTQLYKTS